MKKHLALLMLLIGSHLALAQYTNVYIGSTPNDGTGDTLPVAFAKINYGFGYYGGILSLNSNNLPTIKTNQSWLLTTATNLNTSVSNLNLVALTNNGYGVFLNGGNLAAGTVNSNALDAATLTWLNTLGGSGGPGFTDITNAATAITVLSSNGVVGWVNTQNFITTLTTNIARTSKQITLYQSNAFTMSGSNYVGRFSQVYKTKLTAPIVGGGGLVLGYSLNENLYGSYSGSNSWFPLAYNTPYFTNISISVVGSNTTGIGAITLWGLDHPECYGNTVSFDGQTLLSGGSPIASQADLSAYIHVLAPPVQMSGGWILDSQTTTAGEYVSFINHNNEIFKLSATGSSISNAPGGIDGTGTNELMMTPTNYLVSGWFMEVVTNLTPPIIWQVTTNYTMTTNSGVVTFAIPMNFTLTAQFFRLRSTAQVTGKFSVPITFTGGTLWPSNTWNLTTITNGMQNGDVITVNSNGQKLVDVWMSNTVPILKPHW